MLGKNYLNIVLKQFIWSLASDAWIAPTVYNAINIIRCCLQLLVDEFCSVDNSTQPHMSREVCHYWAPERHHQISHKQSNTLYNKLTPESDPNSGLICLIWDSIPKCNHNFLRKNLSKVSKLFIKLI